MRNRVFFQFEFCNKIATALYTGKYFLIMPFHVYSKTAGLVKALTTYVADVWTFSGVKSLMFFETTGTIETCKNILHYNFPVFALKCLVCAEILYFQNIENLISFPKPFRSLESSILSKTAFLSFHQILFCNSTQLYSVYAPICGIEKLDFINGLFQQNILNSNRLRIVLLVGSCFQGKIDVKMVSLQSILILLHSR